MSFPSDTRAVLIDVGFTLSAFDGERIAEVARLHGVAVSAAAVEAAEPALRREMSAADWSFAPRGEGARRGEAFHRRLLTLAGARVSDDTLSTAAAQIWDAHVRRNVWTRVLPGVREALAALTAAGLRLAVVSNSEGNMAPLLDELGLARHFTAILDSTAVGVAKPDPRIFAMALAALGCGPAQAVMVGDSLAADVEGARRAGIAAALIDPLGLHPDADVPRFVGLADFARRLLAR